MKILVVDDDQTNRMVLTLLLTEYMNSNSGISFEVDEAQNGLEAVEQAQKNKYDIIFTDINMPVMNGIEACKKIRSRDSKVMIIAISSAGDDDSKAEILNQGAEDYIPKPVDADIFNARLKHYMTLVESRKKKSQSSSAENLYTDKVFSRCTIFMLNSEDALAEFWEFFLLNARKKSNFLSDVIRTIVAIAEKQMKFNKNSRVYIEESDDRQYFTLVNIAILPKKVVELFLLKNGVDDGYKLTEDRLSFELMKAKQYTDEIQEEPIVEKKEAVVTEEEIPTSPSSEYVSNELQVFDYIDEDDLADLEEYSEDLNSLMLLVGGGSLSENDVIEMCGFLDKISTLLTPYVEVYIISDAIGNLSLNLLSHIEEFTKNSQMLGPMCIAFSRDLRAWITQSFHVGAPSIDFMNDTIVVNCQTIVSMLKMDEVVETDDDFDDIFDF